MRSVMTSLSNKVLPVYLTAKSGSHHQQQLNESAVDLAVSLLRKGKIVGLPTDTIYGIACSAQNNDGLSEMYEIKKRDQLKPVAICVADVADLFKWSRVTVSEQVLRDLLPGPVTLVFERLNVLNNALNPKTSLIGIRIPDNEFIRTVARLCQFPLALTSANLSSYKSSLSVQEFEDLFPALDAVFDGGQLGAIDPERLGSTVVDLSQQGSYQIIRKGCASHLVTTVLSEKYKLKEV